METELDKRRIRHLQSMEARHRAEFDTEYGYEKTRQETRREALKDVMSELWNRHRPDADQKPAIPDAAAKPAMKPVLPEGWEHLAWKTRQKLARDLAGVDTKTAREADAALKAYASRQPN